MKDNFKSTNIPFVFLSRSMNVSFGNGVTPSIGIMKLRFRCPSGGGIDTNMDILNRHIALLLALCETRQHKFQVEYLANSMKNKKVGMNCPFEQYERTSLFAVRLLHINIKTVEIEQIHITFFQSSNEKM